MTTTRENEPLGGEIGTLIPGEPSLLVEEITMVPRRHTSAGRLALAVALAVTALGAPFGGSVSGAGEPSAGEVKEVSPQRGTVSVVESYDQPPTPAAAGATGTEAELNLGRVPPVPGVEGGVIGEGLNEPTVLLPPGAQGEEAPDDLIFATQPVVATDNAGSIAEPQVAANQERMLLTWNWGAAQSLDGGGTFRYLDPYTAFPSAADGFCCDQLAAYIPGRDLWVWVLQYEPTPGPSGSNVVRLALAPGDEAFDALSFTTFDLTAQDAGFPDGVWLDQPKVGWTDGFLFLSINGYTPLPPDGDGAYVASVVWRLSIDRLLSGALSGNVLTTETTLDGAGGAIFAPYPIRDSGATMYLAAHSDEATLGIWSWDDDSSSPAFRTISSQTATGEPLAWPLTMEPYSCPLEGAADPVASDWCIGSGPRIGSGWRRDDVIGFAWNVPQSPDWSALYPWVWVIEIDTTSIDRCEDGGCVVGRPYLWLPDTAIQYATLAANEAGDLGGVVLAGGGRQPLACWAVSRPHDAPPEAGWNLLGVAQSDAESPEPRSGDYLGVAPFGSDGAAWIATCMTLHVGGQTGTAARVHVASFGQRADLED